MTGTHLPWLVIDLFLFYLFFPVVMERTRRVKKPPKGDLKSPRLIELVGKNPILWDPTYPGYKDVSQKELVWTSISKHFYGSTGLILFGHMMSDYDVCRI